MLQNVFSYDVYEMIGYSFDITMDWVNLFDENGKSIKLTYNTD